MAQFDFGERPRPMQRFDPQRRRLMLGSAALAAMISLAGKTMAATRPRDEQIEQLIADMTLEEKVGQLHMEGALTPKMGTSDFIAMNPWAAGTTTEMATANHTVQLNRIQQGLVGFLAGPFDLDAARDAQAAAVRSRLGIPLLLCADIVHGFRTIFPVPLAEAASWEPDLARRTARASAVEGAAAGHDLTFSPMVDIGRDQRWGRVVEGSGEDPYLGALFAAARVKGYQGELGAADSLIACAKHFAAYGAAESGLDYGGANISERILREVYLPPFQAAVEAGALAIMSSFNTIDGVPSTGNRKLLTDILRGEMGFPGVVISDYESEREMILHGYAADERDAARIALTAGCDVGMISAIYPRNLPSLVRDGVLPVAVVDEAVRRVLWVKKSAGLFKDPMRRIDDKRYTGRGTDAAHAELARDAARRSVVLLKNDNNRLPLNRHGTRIALIGPFAADTANLDGPWSPHNTAVPAVPLDVGIRRAMADERQLTVVPGCAADGPIPGGIEKAVAAASAAHVVILALGETTAMSGEAASRTELTLPPAQQALAEAVAKTGKPLVVVLRNGRALVLEGAVAKADSILVGWFLGSQTGPALADLIFGAASPSGRLPISFPRATGQEPLYYSRENTGRPANPADVNQRFTAHFLGLPHRPAFPFGYGLTYSQVDYGPVALSAPDLPWNGQVAVSCEVRNSGRWPVEEVVQLYVHDKVASIAPPIRLLKGFQKIALKPGERQTVSFTLSRGDLTFFNSALQKLAEPGQFEVWIAPHAEAGTPAVFTLQPG